ncbi:MerR family transcriptional regulator [Aerococcus urinaehominis]|uniref:MerR family transcriptional regulator n=1 Tax=Aerococcus urinaehominis TaxID=128944 RepID=A0A0X8FL28_9LACT|nr:MerR family transcriptional regulator [Aerococcus urinaehominis]AMB99301.1 MerR family transcriptional regulator [Aerococcus urinaehominis]SDM19494.1 MerR family transcriptional regulator, glutamine synthetase repressor [Aerococcus urinaehominis]
MKEKELRRSMAVFPIGTVMKLTDLTARQIRYYEEQGLVKPQRTDTNRRMYSLNDVDQLLDIKDYLQEGYSVHAIRRIYEENDGKAPAGNKTHVESEKAPLTDDDVRRILYDEIVGQGGFRDMR